MGNSKNNSDSTRSEQKKKKGFFHKLIKSTSKFANKIGTRVKNIGGPIPVPPNMMKCVNKLEKINDTYTTDFGELLKEWTDNVYNTGATENWYQLCKGFKIFCKNMKNPGQKNLSEIITDYQKQLNSYITSSKPKKTLEYRVKFADALDAYLDKFKEKLNNQLCRNSDGAAGHSDVSDSHSLNNKSDSQNGNKPITKNLEEDLLRQAKSLSNMQNPDDFPIIYLTESRKLVNTVSNVPPKAVKDCKAYPDYLSAIKDLSENAQKLQKVQLTVDNLKTNTEILFRKQYLEQASSLAQQVYPCPQNTHFRDSLYQALVAVPDKFADCAAFSIKTQNKKETDIRKTIDEIKKLKLKSSDPEDAWTSLDGCRAFLQEYSDLVTSRCYRADPDRENPFLSQFSNSIKTVLLGLASGSASDTIYQNSIDEIMQGVNDIEGSIPAILPLVANSSYPPDTLKQALIDTLDPLKNTLKNIIEQIKSKGPLSKKHSSDSEIPIGTTSANPFDF